MHFLQYDRHFSRRKFLQEMAAGILSTGVLCALWEEIAKSGEISRAYPDELLSIDEYTKGRVKTGDVITAENVDHVRNLLDPIRYRQIAEMGRRLKVVPTTREITALSPHDYIEATLRHKGRARFDVRGNVVTDDGKPWIGGHPFPEPRSPLEVFAGHTLSWGRHDVSMYPVKEYDVTPDGEVDYIYESVWVEFAPVARVTVNPKPYWPGHEDRLRYQTVFFTRPNEVRGTAYLNIWPYDQNLFPEMYGYLPAFKRVRRFPTNQRFEPLVPGSSLYLSDAWAAGDPFLTWGNYRLVGRGPTLASLSDGWNADHPNWEHGTHGGRKGKTFWDMSVELVPEALVIEAEPVMFVRAPVLKKWVWFDARTLLPIGMVTFDRKGNLFRSFDGAYSLYRRGSREIRDGVHPYWSWTHFHAHNLQTNRITRVEQVRKVAGGYEMRVNDVSVYDRFLTRAALRSLGS